LVELSSDSDLESNLWGRRLSVELDRKKEGLPRLTRCMARKEGLSLILE
jgi:hypothetical protein